MFAEGLCGLVSANKVILWFDLVTFFTQNDLYMNLTYITFVRKIILGKFERKFDKNFWNLE